MRQCPPHKLLILLYSIIRRFAMIYLDWYCKFGITAGDIFTPQAGKAFRFARL